ncbi:hypothetical protein KI387_014916, partial [Taxus chinensis]
MEGSLSNPLKGRTFSIELSSDGAAHLREVIKEKLSEFMGSYTDDVLAEYVVVLVCHGKHQDQAKKDLDAFLGDHSSAFVAWLWDHVASNIHDYLPASQTSRPVDIKEKTKNHLEDGVKRSFVKQSRSIDMESKSKGDNRELVSDVTHREVIERPSKVPGTRRRREWANVHKSSREVKETPKQETLRQETEYEERNDSRAGQNSHSRGKSSSKRHRSPEKWMRRERLRRDESHDKRKLSPTGLHAPRRLLQSAVREAVGPIGPTHSNRLESSRKRLRSVVSTNVEYSNELLDAAEDSNRPRALAKSLPAMAVAVKAAAAAAEDVAKIKSTGSVFDRLGQNLESDLNGLHEADEEYMLDDEGNDIENTMTEAVCRGHKYQHRSEIHNRLNRGLIDDIAMTDRESIIPSDPISEEYDEVQEHRRHTQRYAGASSRRKQLENRESDGVSRVSTFKERQAVRHEEPEKRPEESLTVQYRVAKKSQEMARESRVQKTPSETPSASRKILNISVNVNTWKPTHFQPPRDAVTTKTKTSKVDSNLLQDHTETGIDGTLRDETDMVAKDEVGQIVPAADPNGASNADNSSDIRKVSSTSGVGTSGRTPEDADSRTVFVSNVHFAATKESLSKHFSRYGEIVKVTIQTDAATSQPKGSAYVEFGSKEMAEMALSLNETSFMSRMLK